MPKSEAAAIVGIRLTAAIGACDVTVRDDDDNGRTTPAGRGAPVQPAPAVPARPSAMDLRFVVDMSDRKLYVLRGADTVRAEPVAVGTREHPTPTGEWTIHRVDWNPDWTPPPGEEWTEDKEPQPPGSPKNPMGRVRLVFNPPYTVHGTRERESLGKAESHGSIRVSNPAAVELGRMVMEAGGAMKEESFFQRVEANRKKMQQVSIPRPISISIQQ